MGTKTQKLSNVVDQIVEWQSVFTGDGSTGITAVAGRGYLIDTTSGTVTVTLPASPKVGDKISIKDYAATFSTNNVTVARNGNNIEGNALDVTLEENTLNIKDYKNNIKLELVNFGEGQNTLQESGLSDLAIDYDFDRHLIKVLESIRGTLNIIPINRNIVLHNPNTDEILITKPC